MNKWEQEWTINFGSGDIVVPPKKTVFTLHKHVADRIEYYHMEISSGDLCLGWEAAEFIKFGKAPLVWPRALQLPPWPAVHDPDIAQLYQDNIAQVLATVATANTLRLEGEVEFDGEIETEAKAAALGGKGPPVPGVFIRMNRPNTKSVLVAGNHTFYKRVAMIIGEKAIFDEKTQKESDLLLVPITPFLGLAQGPIDDGTAHGNGKPKP